MLDLYKLEIFSAVVQEGSFSGAANRLLMTQSAVSQHIQSLEAALGVALFERHRRGVTPTEAGKTLNEYTEAIFKLVAEAENAVTNVERLTDGQVAIGASPGVSVYLLPNWVQAFRAHHPNLTVSLRTDITPQIVAEVRARRIDLGIVEGELTAADRAQLGVAPLQEFDQFVVVGRKHPWWGRERVSIDAIDGQSMITRQPHSQTRVWLEHVLLEHGVQPRIAAEFDHLESIKRAVMAGQCLTIMPTYTVEQEQQLGLLHVIPIDGNPLQRMLKLIWNPEAHLSPVARAFMAHLGEYFPDVGVEDKV
ncbi:MAG: LysR family transcriptional regulator [Anaerolineae bacterium]|nr:LysR family transcriptional regulator [Anaerolineae bacterium]